MRRANAVVVGIDEKERRRRRWRRWLARSSVLSTVAVQPLSSQPKKHERE